MGATACQPSVSVPSVINRCSARASAKLTMRNWQNMETLKLAQPVSHADGKVAQKRSLSLGLAVGCVLTT